MANLTNLTSAAPDIPLNENLSVPWLIFGCMFASSTVFAITVYILVGRTRSRLAQHSLSQPKAAQSSDNECGSKGQVMQADKVQGGKRRTASGKPSKGVAEDKTMRRQIDLCLEKITPAPFSLSNESGSSISI